MKSTFSNIFLLFFFLIPMFKLWAQKPIALPFAHAHNDYEKIFRPDFKAAIKAGCSSIEIDVFPYKGRLKIAHIPLFLGWRRDFEQRYLRPLSRYIKEQGGHLYQDPKQRLILMVDIKRNAPEAYRQLRQLAEKYKDILAVWYPKEDSLKNGAVELLLSGAKPYSELHSDSVWYMRIDGGFGNIGDTIYSAKIAPRLSSSYRGNFSWRGRGEMPARELEALRELVRRAHADGRQVRFWAMPNRLKVWQLMRAEGVDWLNVDRIKKLEKNFKVLDSQ